MKILAIDPGATHCGWSVLEGDGEVAPNWCGSGIFGLERLGNQKAKEAFQAYKLRLIDFWAERAVHLLDNYSPDLIVSEIIPPVGGGNFVVATQSHLAATVSTVIQTIGVTREIGLKQVSANSVKRKIGGVKDASKAKVRDGVFELCPAMDERYPDKRRPDKLWDEFDSVAVALWGLGYSR